MYQAMTSLGFAAESPYRGPIRLEGDPKGASVVILGAGLAGMTAAYELGRAGYQVQVLEYNARRGRPELVDSRRRRLCRARRRHADLRVRRRPLSQSGALANPLPPPCHPRLLPPVRRRARAVHPAQSQRLSSFDRGVRRQAAANPRGQGRFRGGDRRTPGQGDAQRARSTRRCRRRTRRSCSRRCAPTAASTATFVTERATSSASYRGYAKDPGGGLGAGRSTASRSGCTTS